MGETAGTLTERLDALEASLAGIQEILGDLTESVQRVERLMDEEIVRMVRATNPDHAQKLEALEAAIDALGEKVDALAEKI